MTQAFNLSQLANKVNTSGQLDASTGLYNNTVFSTTNYTIYESGGILYFKYGSTNILSLNSSGDLTAL
jgi:hypothetical protein